MDGRPYKYRCKDALRGKGSCKELKDDNPQGKEDREYDDVSAGNMKLTYGKEVAQGPLADGNFDGGPSYVPSTPRAQWAASIVAPKKEKPPASPFHMHQVLGSSYPVPIHPNHKAGNGVPINSDTLQVPKDKKGNIYGQSPSSFAGGTDNSAAATSMPVQPGFPDQKVCVLVVDKLIHIATHTHVCTREMTVFAPVNAETTLHRKILTLLATLFV